MSEGFPSKLRNRELTGNCFNMPQSDLSKNPKLWYLIVPKDLKEWDTEGAQILYNLWESRIHHRLTIDYLQCKETLQECTTLAELHHRIFARCI
jgi:hypothetical protein